MDKRANRFTNRKTGLKVEEVVKSSFWKDRYKNIWSFICPLCEAVRRVPFRPRPGGARQVSQVALTTLIFTLLCWKWMSWKGVVAYVPFWMIFEFIYRAKMRAALSCPQCGFDPYLFLVDIKRARREIETHWRKKFADKGIPYPEPATPRKSPAPEAPPSP